MNPRTENDCNKFVILCYLNGKWLVGRLVPCEKGLLFRILFLTMLSAFVKKKSLLLCEAKPGSRGQSEIN
jgi:hypothetical protein